MNIILGIAIVAAIYLLVYGIAKVIATVAVFIKIPWAVLAAGCAAVIIYLRQYSAVNYAVVVIAILLLAKLLVSQAEVIVQKMSGAYVFDKEAYRSALIKSYASLYTLLVFGALYANTNYILLVKLGGISMEDYQDAGIFNGKFLSLLGLGPVKWVILICAILAGAWAYSNAGDILLTSMERKKTAPAPKTTVGNYFTDVLGIPVSIKGDTVDAARSALNAYFESTLDDIDKRNALMDAILNAASFEITDTSELLETLKQDSGLSTDEIITYLPKLGVKS